MGIFNTIKAMATETKVEFPTYFTAAPVSVFKKKGGDAFHFNYRPGCWDAGFLRVDLWDLAKEEATFAQNVLLRYTRPKTANPMAILHPSVPGTVRAYLKLDRDRFEKEAKEIHNAIKEAYGLHLGNPKAKAEWTRLNGGLYKKLILSFKGAFTLRMENDGVLAYVGEVDEVLDYGILSDDRKTRIFRANPADMVDPTAPQQSWFERYAAHSNKEINSDIISQAQERMAQISKSKPEAEVQGF
jgi:hypothetical protein